MTAPSRQVAIVGAVLGGAVGVVGIAGWLGHVAAVTRAATGLAPFSAVALLVLGFLLAARALNAGDSRLLDVVVVVVVVTAFLSLLDHLTGVALSPERWLLGAAAAAHAGFRESRLLSDLLIVLLGASMMLEAGRRGRRAAGLVATAVGLCALVAALGYAYRVPLFIGGTRLAVSLPASLGFLALAAGLVAQVGPGAPPLVWLAGPASRRVLLRWFLPVTLAAVLLSDLLIQLLPTRLNPALASTLTALVTAGCAGVVVTLVSRRVGRSLDRVTKALSDSEARYRTTLEGMLEGCQIVGRDWRYLYLNEAAAAHGRRARGDLLGRTMTEVYPGIDRSPMFAALRECMEHRVPQSLENEFQYPDGSSGWFELSMEPVPEGVFILSLDISKRKRAEEEIRRLNTGLERRVADRTAELTALNAELEAFTYSVSHDLRAPLRQADGFAKILLEDYCARLDETGRHYLERVREGTRFMGQLVDELLNLSRLGRREVARRRVSLDTILRECVEDLRSAAQGRRIEWRLASLPEADCDAALVRQVFANLLGNAVKFTRPRDPAVIEVAPEPIEGAVAVVVRDNGVGFDPRYTAKLFGVFQRLHRQEEFEGTGIGLATVQRIIHKHGGRVWAEGEPGRGAAFHFTLGPDGGSG